MRHKHCAYEKMFFVNNFCELVFPLHYVLLTNKKQSAAIRIYMYLQHHKANINSSKTINVGVVTVHACTHAQ